MKPDRAPVVRGLAATTLCLVLAGPASPQQPDFYTPAYTQRIVPETYVTAEAGHLYYGGKRLRLWGYNVQGAFPDYESIRFLARRLQQLGVTGVRLGPLPGTFYTVASAAAHEFMPARQGDKSLLDRYDFLVAQLKERGIFIQSMALYYINAEAILAWDPRFRELLGPDVSQSRMWTLNGIAPYISEPYLAMVEGHIGNYLKRVNPYTGKRYADEEVFSGWELANESSFVHCMFSRDCVGKLPEALKSLWTEQWVQFAADKRVPAGSETPVFDADWNTADSPRHRAYREVVVTRFVRGSQRLEKAARSHGRPRAGISVQPIAHNTQAGPPLAAAHAANSAGDMMAISVYQSPLSKEASEYFPWRPYLARQPLLYNFNFGAVAGKPLIVYETSFFRPYTYRAEWAGIMLGLGAQQDWDAIYLYMYGQPRIIYSGNGGGEGYGAMPLPEPVAMLRGQSRDYTFGFHHGGDPAIVSAWMAAAAAFRSEGVFSCEQRKVFRFEQDQVYGLPPGYCDARGGCPGKGPGLINAMNQASLQQPIRLVLGVHAGGKAPSSREVGCAADGGERGSVSWRPASAHAVIQSPAYFGIFGKIQNGDGLPGIMTIAAERPFFGVLAIHSADGRVLAESRDLRIHVGGEVSNTGFSLDPTGINFDIPYGAIGGVRAAGSTPLVYSLPTVKVTLKGGGQLSRFDFSLNNYAREAVTDGFTIQPSEKFFVGRVLRPAGR